MASCGLTGTVANGLSIQSALSVRIDVGNLLGCLVPYGVTAGGGAVQGFPCAFPSVPFGNVNVVEIQTLLVARVAEHFRSFITIVSEEVLVCRSEVIIEVIMEFIFK